MSRQNGSCGIERRPDSTGVAVWGTAAGSVASKMTPVSVAVVSPRRSRRSDCVWKRRATSARLPAALPTAGPVRASSSSASGPGVPAAKVRPRSSRRRDSRSSEAPWAPICSSVVRFHTRASCTRVMTASASSLRLRCSSASSWASALCASRNFTSSSASPPTAAESKRLVRPSRVLSASAFCRRTTSPSTPVTRRRRAPCRRQAPSTSAAKVPMAAWLRRAASLHGLSLSSRNAASLSSRRSVAMCSRCAWRNAFSSARPPSAANAPTARASRATRLSGCSPGAR